MQKKIQACSVKVNIYPYKGRHFHNALLELVNYSPLFTENLQHNSTPFKNKPLTSINNFNQWHNMIFL